MVYYMTEYLFIPTFVIYTRWEIHNITHFLCGFKYSMVYIRTIHDIFYNNPLIL